MHRTTDHEYQTIDFRHSCHLDRNSAGAGASSLLERHRSIHEGRRNRPHRTGVSSYARRGPERVGAFILLLPRPVWPMGFPLLRRQPRMPGRDLLQSGGMEFDPCSGQLGGSGVRHPHLCQYGVRVPAPECHAAAAAGTESARRLSPPFRVARGVDGTTDFPEFRRSQGGVPCIT